MDSWQRKDITQWRQKHAQTLDLIVTRAVCNEIAEHIQHLRGNLPPGGLTSKPKWYLNRQNTTAALPEGSPKKCYFRRAGKATDFTNGASIFWLGWVDKEPNAWQVALPLPGIDLIPGNRLVDGRTKDGTDWSVRTAGSALTRTRRPDVVVPSVVELRRRGMTDREIEKYRAEPARPERRDEAVPALEARSHRGRSGGAHRWPVRAHLRDRQDRPELAHRR